jgi:hypothetical protein
MMNDRKRVSWMLFVCVTTSPLVGCDESSGDQPGSAMLEFGEVDIVVPRVQGKAGSTVPASVVALASVPDAVPVIADAQVKSPTDQLVIGWLRWANAQPWLDGAIADTTGEKCGLDQAGPVWYLAGTSGGPTVRECDVPLGKKLFFPLVNRWCVFPDEFYENDEQIASDIELIKQYFFDFEHENLCSLTLRIDGQEVRPDLESLDEDFYIQVLEPFELDLHDEHWAPDAFEGGIMPAIGAGHYALVQPLTPGDHVIEFGGGICGEYPFSTSVTYLLHVGN